MDDLAPGLQSQILTHLITLHTLSASASNLTTPQKPTLHSYATVSRHWQITIETHTFCSIRLQSTDLISFSDIFGDQRKWWRRAALRRLEYIVLLPGYSERRAECFETGREARANDICFGTAVKGLLDILAGWDRSPRVDVVRSAGGGEGEQRRGSLTVLVDVHSSTDPGLRRSDWLGIGWWRYAGSVIDFDEDVDGRPGTMLPDVSCIDGFSFQSTRVVDHDAIGRILSALPRVRTVELKFMQPRMRREALRREQWGALGRLLVQLAESSSTETLQLYSEFQEPWNHSFEPGDMRDPESRIDQTTLALHKLAMSSSSSLRSLNLYGYFLVSPRLFWPCAIKDKSSGAAFQFSSTLSYINIHANTHAPNGKWYYTGRPDSVGFDTDDLFTGAEDDYDNDAESSSSATASDDSTHSPVRPFINDRAEEFFDGDRPHHQWRLQIDDERFNRLLTAMVRAVSRLLRLRKFSFCMGNDLPDIRRVIVKAADVGEMITDEYPHETDNEVASRRWRVWAGRDLRWELPVEIEAEMKEWVGESGIVQKYHWPAHVPRDANRA